MMGNRAEGLIRKAGEEEELACLFFPYRAKLKHQIIHG
jgi:hypothetical protein